MPESGPAARQPPRLGGVNIAVWGSCVTRDALEIRPHDFDVITYFARTSWVAQAAPRPSAEPTIGPELAGKFGERMVREDFGRLVVERLVASAPDLVVFDLIDERFDVLDTGAGAWITESDYLKGTPMFEDLADVPRNPLLSAVRAQLFARSVDQLAPRLLEALPGVPIVLHGSFYTSVSTDPEAQFYANATRDAALMNAALATLGRELQRGFGDRILTYVGDPATRVADAGHKWGLSMYHYAEPYYVDLLDALEAVVAGRTHRLLLERGAPIEPPSVAVEAESVRRRLRQRLPAPVLTAYRSLRFGR